MHPLTLLASSALLLVLAAVLVFRDPATTVTVSGDLAALLMPLTAPLCPR